MTKMNTIKPIAKAGAYGQPITGKSSALISAVDNLRRIATCESKIMSHTQTRDKAPESRLMPAFAVQELPPLTAQELAELAQAQQARNSID